MLADNTNVQELLLTPELFLDRTTVLFGRSKSGKSTIIIDILYQLKSFIDQIIVICPTDLQNHTYDNGIVPLPCIWYEFKIELLNTIWERQEAFVAIYNRANRMQILQQLFNKIPQEKTSIERRAVGEVKASLDKFKAEMGDSALATEKITQKEADFNEFVSLVYKDKILKNRAQLSQLRLTDDEHHSLKYIDFNPRLVIVFDDCTDQLKQYAKEQIISKMWTMNRHQKITIINASHSDSCFLPATKKYTFVTMFTDELAANAYFGRATNDFDKELKKQAVIAKKVAFTQVRPWQRLAWVGCEGKFYKFTATPRVGFTFGCDAFRNYCEKVRTRNGGLPLNNKFIHRMM